jgi:hypothetical protein
MGRGTINTRVVIGAMIVKYILKLDDREVVHTLQENIYLGLAEKVSYKIQPLILADLKN